MKRIFYSNINYSCNSNCIFCYSHNTIHTGKPHKEIACQKLSEYWTRFKVDSFDRVIINGGEPLLHQEITEIFNVLTQLGCETLVYTNGRLASLLQPEFIDVPTFRFIIPVHGYRELHDEITGVLGSYDQMLTGIQNLMNKQCKVDLKIILNSKMVEDERSFNETFTSLQKIPFNNAIHITKMAETIVSKKNRFSGVDNLNASFYTEKLVKFFISKGIVKIFDTCVKDISKHINTPLAAFKEPLEVFFKDCANEKKIELTPPIMDCWHRCSSREFCRSAVSEYTVLEISNNQIRINLE